MLELGRVVERYLVERELGEGGMAHVFAVRHTFLKTQHALKVLKIGGPAIRERLLREGQLQASLKHPNIVAVTDVIDVDGAPGLLMEFVAGGSLDGWLDDHRPTVGQAVAIFRGIASGLGRAHAAGMIHRDLKPGNILLELSATGPIPKVADFGLAKILLEGQGGVSATRSGSAMGTPAYMSPEQIRDAKNTDKRTDIWALGCILYELCCGNSPFDGPDLLAILSAAADGRYVPPEERCPGLPPAVGATIRACLMVDRARRPADCGAMVAMLDGPAPAKPSAFPDAGAAVAQSPGGAPLAVTGWRDSAAGAPAGVAAESADVGRPPQRADRVLVLAAETWAGDEPVPVDELRWRRSLSPPVTTIAPASVDELLLPDDEPSRFLSAVSGSQPPEEPPVGPALVRGPPSAAPAVSPPAAHPALNVVPTSTAPHSGRKGPGLRAIAVVGVLAAVAVGGMLVVGGGLRTWMSGTSPSAATPVIAQIPGDPAALTVAGTAPPPPAAESGPVATTEGVPKPPPAATAATTAPVPPTSAPAPSIGPSSVVGGGQTVGPSGPTKPAAENPPASKSKSSPTPSASTAALPAAPPTEPVASGSVTLEGDAKSVWLMSAGVRKHLGAVTSVPAGTYTITVVFESGKPVSAGTLTITADSTATLHCDAMQQRCGRVH